MISKVIKISGLSICYIPNNLKHWMKLQFIINKLINENKYWIEDKLKVLKRGTGINDVICNENIALVF